MKSFISISLVLIFAGYLHSSSASALELKLHDNHSTKLNAVLALGAIETGDALQIEAFFEALPKKPNNVVYLASNGGSLYEGIALGVFFRQHRIKTVVEGGQLVLVRVRLHF